MNQVTKQTETRFVRPENNMARRIVGTVFGIVQILLGMRLIFALLGANRENAFIGGLRSITHFVVGTFEGIFPEFAVNEIANAVFEPATLIAMVVVALIGWVVTKLLSPQNSDRVQRTEVMNTAIHEQPRVEPNQQNRQ